jgi:hypothetical protein
MRAKRSLSACLFMAAVVCFLAPGEALAQGKSHKKDGPVVMASASIVLTKDMRVEIHDWYAGHPVGNVEALPPGIRMRLARGKPLPPGIAKKVAPSGLRSRIRVPNGYQVYEVGLDVLLVEVATGIVHDILMDVVR